MGNPRKCPNDFLSLLILNFSGGYSESGDFLVGRRLKQEGHDRDCCWCCSQWLGPIAFCKYTVLLDFSDGRLACSLNLECVCAARIIRRPSGFIFISIGIGDRVLTMGATVTVPFVSETIAVGKGLLSSCHYDLLVVGKPKNFVT